MKKIITMFSVMCLVANLVVMPVKADTSYKVLYDENYENTSALDLTITQTEKQNDSVISDIDESNSTHFGLGNKAADFRTDMTQWGCMYTVFERSENIKAGENSISGYTVDMSFDLCPAEGGTKIRILAEGSAGFDTGNNVMGLEFTESKNIRYYERNSRTVIEEKALSDFFNESTLSAEHFYRIRIVFYVNNASGSPYCDVYVDGVKIFENKTYAQNNKQKYIAGIGLGSSYAPDEVISIGRLDNIYVAAYDDETKDEFSLSIPRDLLLAAIRNAGVVLENEALSDSGKESLSTAIMTAIGNYESDDEAVLSEAFESLKGAVKEAEEDIANSGNTDPVDPDNPDVPDIPDTPDNPDVPQEKLKYLIKNDYESGTDLDLTITNNNYSDESQIADVDIKDTLYFGLGDKFADFRTNSNANVTLYTTFEKSEKIISTENDIFGYTVEVSFDFCPGEKGSKIRVLGSNGSKIDESNNIMGLAFTSVNEIKYYERETTTVTETKNLKDYLKEIALSSEHFYRVRIVLYVNNSVGTPYCDVYVDGVKIFENKAFAQNTKQSYAAGLGIGPSTALEKVTGVGKLDNLSVVSYDETSNRNLSLDLSRDLLLSSIRTAGAFSKNEKLSEDEKIILNTAIETAIESYNSDDEVVLSETFAALDIAVKMAEISLKPIQGIFFVDSIKYSSSELKGSNNISADITILTSRLADDVNDILALLVLYRNSENYPGGEVISISSDTAAAGKLASVTLNPSIDLSGYTDAEKENLFIKTYVLSGKDRLTHLPSEDFGIGNIPIENGVIDKLYGEKADIYKKESNDGKLCFSFSSVTEKNDEILIYAAKSHDGVNVDISDITGNNSNDILVYFNVCKVNAQGECNVLFNPSVKGKYRIVAYSQKKGRIFDKVCAYEDHSTLSQIFSELKSGIKQIADVKKELDLDGDLFNKCLNTGIDVNEITKEILTENKEDVYNFKIDFMKNMNILYNIKTASNLDSVVKTLNDNGLKTSDKSYVWNQICEYVYANKEKATSPAALEKLLEYKPKENNSGGGGGAGGGGSSGGSGGSAGYVTTAAVDKEKTENETPYEKNASVFNDISDVSWAVEAIIFLAEKNVINGKADGVFAPNDTITREEFAKIVANTFGIETESEIPAFLDVDKNSWYYPYIVRVYSEGIAKGVAEDSFGIGMNISREDAIVMLYRAGGLKGASYSDKAEYIPFEDGCSPYAEEAVKVFAKSGIITGTGNNMLNAKKTLTRAEAAKMVYGLYTFINQN